MGLIEINAFQSFSSEPEDTQIHQLIRAGDETNIKLLIQKGIYLEIENGVDLEKKGKDFLTPLGLAISLKQVAITRLLIEAGASVNNGEKLPLVLAANRGYLEIIKMLIEAGAKVNLQQGNSPSMSALDMAASCNRNTIVKYLINAGAEVNFQDCEGWTPLMSAVAKGNLETVKILLRAGAKVNVTDIDRYSILDIARQNNRSKIVNLLEKAGAKSGQELLYD